MKLDRSASADWLLKFASDPLGYAHFLRVKHDIANRCAGSPANFQANNYYPATKLAQAVVIQN